MAKLKPKLPKAPTGRALAVFVGNWATEVVFPDMPPLRGTTSFRWLEKNALLLMQSRIRGKGPPKSVAIIGGDDSSNQFRMLYSDERGVTRHYEMTLSTRLWVLTRAAEGFHQRFIGRISPDRRTIRGYWEKSKTGRKWQHDFELTYTRKR